jgi:nitric oxide reductase NorD protein
MRRARRLYLKARHLASVAVDDVRRRWHAGDDVRVELETVRRRLELLLAALHGHTPRIETAGGSRQAGLDDRTVRLAGRHRSDDVLAANDGETIRLPAVIEARDTETAIAKYRLLALEQAERVRRGTAGVAAGIASRLERDLFLLREGAAVDAALSLTLRGARDSLIDARAEALSRRPIARLLTPAEREVEAMVRRTLQAAPESPPREFGTGDEPADSLSWARDTAKRLVRRGGLYRGLQSVGLWGAVLTPGIATSDGTTRIARERGGADDERRSPRARDDGSADRRQTADGGETMLTRDLDAAQSLVEHEQGVEISSDDGVGGDDTVSAPNTARVSRVAPSSRGISYPEWDYTTGAYRPRAVIVRQEDAPQSESTWADDVLSARAPLVREIRERFERLRARRSRLTQQRDGEELDLAACVRAIVDMKTGHAADDRLYIAVRPARRALAIALLVDVSGSTDTPVNPLQQVIDVEKEAVLLASEALDALGDRYLIVTFSGTGADDVRLGTVKGFDEPNGAHVRRRISAMAPQGNTRLGAALRHATALLAREPAGHRLLLIVSDGRPNDIAWYHEEYGVEDSRQAINEARAKGVFPYCLTVDREGAEYLPRIFGEAGHSILRHPDQLPTALVSVVRGLLG